MLILTPTTRCFPRVVAHATKTLTTCTYCLQKVTSSPTQSHSSPHRSKDPGDIVIGDKAYKRDAWTNVSPRLLTFLGFNLHQNTSHPLCFAKQRIIGYMYRRFVNSRGNPLFSVHENVSPVVSTEQNFDSLNIPADHPSRSRADTYYLDADTVLRSHTSAHQADLVRSGLDNFLVVGDVYRKDAVDPSHYPVFHQVEAVRLRSHAQLFHGDNEVLRIFEKGERTPEKQERHTLEAVKLTEHEMKECLIGLVKHLFGKDLECRWVDAFFPFTHPSFELEILHGDKWMEMLGCGIMEHNLLVNAGAGEKIGWAFGLGLERLAMILYGIPDIRLFWSIDQGFLGQFKGKNADTPVTFKPFSKHPACPFDISFWIPEGFSPNDFYEIVRNTAGDIVERIEFVDEFFHPKELRTNHTYRVVYRHMAKVLTRHELSIVHRRIEEAVVGELKVVVRH